MANGIFGPGGMAPPGIPPSPGGSLPIPRFLSSDSQPQLPLPDPSTWELAPPPPVPKKYLDEIKEYACTEMAAGQEMVRNKLSRWKLFEKLVDGTLKLSQWNGVIESLVQNPDVIENEQWQADFVIGAGPVVHSFVDRLFNDLFSTDKFYEVEQQPGIAGGSTEDPLYPTSSKFQALMLHDLGYSQYKTRTYEILVDYATFGTAFAIPFYNRKELIRWRRHPKTGQVVPVPEYQNRLVLESIPLHSILPDVRARNSDTQRWTGVGRRIQMSYSQVLQRFKQGIYTLNEKDFKRVFEEGQEARPESYEIELWRDIALDGVMTGRMRDGTVTAFEWHGEIPVSSGPPRELIVVVIGGRPEDHPESGILVRADHGPALPTGHRPILSSGFTPMPGAFSQGAVQPNLDLIYYMSSMINCLVDNARLSTNAQYKVRRGSSLANKIKTRKKGNKSYPGKIWYVDNADDITPFEPLNFPQVAMTNLVQYFEHQYERRSSVSDTTLAMSSREKTATEAYSLGQMGDVPLKTRLNLYVENIFQPAGNIFVGMLQTNMQGAVTIPVPGPRGVATPQVITADEIRTGKYRVVAAFNKTDQLSLSKAQAMQQLMPTVFNPTMMQAFAIEGKHPSASQWGMKIALLLGLDGVENLFPDMPGEQAQAMQQLMSLPPEQIQALLQAVQQGGVGGQGGGTPNIQPKLMESMNYKDLPPWAQLEMLKEAGINPPGGGNPDMTPPPTSGGSNGPPSEGPPQGGGGIPTPASPNGNPLGEPQGGASSLGHLIGMLAAASRMRNQGGGGPG